MITGKIGRVQAGLRTVVVVDIVNIIEGEIIRRRGMVNAEHDLVPGQGLTPRANGIGGDAPVPQKPAGRGVAVDVPVGGALGRADGLL